jgi:hypothetical protein
MALLSASVGVRPTRVVKSFCQSFSSFFILFFRIHNLENSEICCNRFAVEYLYSKHMRWKN